MGHRAVVGLGLLCALLLSAVMASSASAIVGTTAFTCAPQKPAVKNVGFSDAHCTNAAVDEAAVFKHDSIAEKTKTIFHGTNEKTTADTKGSEVAILRAKPLGVETEIRCNKVFAHGELENKVNAEKEHFIHGTKITILYTECSVPKPAKCVIPGNKIEVTGTTATTEKQEDNVLFKPEVGNTFVSFNFEKCENAFFNGLHEVSGSVRAQVSGSTLTFSEAKTTSDNKLTFFGSAAGLEGKITLSQAAGTAATEKTGNPISATTVST
jgi:hypothetical protein